MDSVHWLFHLVQDLMGAFKNLGISQFYLPILQQKKLTSQFFTLLLLIAWLVNKIKHSKWQNTCISIGKVQINQQFR